VAALALLACGIPTHPLLACDIPVFRYALERWEPYAYEAILFYKEPMDAHATQALQKLESDRANLGIWKVNLSDPMQEEFGVVWEQEKDRATLPWIIVRYPYPSWQTVKTNWLWSGKFDPSVLGHIASSPARRKAAQEILNGCSAVWIFIESGNREADDAKAGILEDHLARVKRETRLPQESNAEAKPLPMPGNVPLKVDFTVIRVSRTDPAEKFFVDMLLKIEKDSDRSADKPMAFPVFGQGRAICPLIGDGIAADRIEQTCAFILGSCSCEIKDANPGVDMLMATDWHRGVTNILSVSDQAPTLVGIGTAEEEKAAAETESAPEPEPPSTARVYRGLGLTFFALVLAVGLVSGLIARQTRDS
jgi:hypothetical protein